VLQHPLAPPENAGGQGFSPAAMATFYFALGDTRKRTLELIEKMVRPGDRVLQCGGVAGIPASLRSLFGKSR